MRSIAVILLTHSAVVPIIWHTDRLALSLWRYISTNNISTHRPISKGSRTQSVSELIGSQLGLMSCPKLIITLWQRLINRWIIVLLPMIDWFGKQSLLLNQMIVVFVEHDHTLGRQITLREHLCYLSFRSPTLVRILLESAVLDVLNLLFLWINFILAFFLAFENILQKFL